MCVSVLICVCMSDLLWLMFCPLCMFVMYVYAYSCVDIIIIVCMCYYMCVLVCVSMCMYVCVDVYVSVC